MFTNARKPTKWHIVEESCVLWNVEKKNVIEMEIHEMWFMVIFFLSLLRYFFCWWKSKQTKIHSTHMFSPVLYFFNQLIFSFVCHIVYTEILMIWLSSCQRVFFTFIVLLLHFRYFVVISLLENWKWKWNWKFKRKKNLFFSRVLYESSKIACIEFCLSVCRVLALSWCFYLHVK